MAIAQPAMVDFEVGQDGTWTVTLSPPEDVTGWTVSTTVRMYNGGPVLITKTPSVSDPMGVFVTAFDAADLTLTPGAYVIQLHRTNAGFVYPITDPSCLLIRPADSTAYPTLTNLGEYAAHAMLGLTLTDALAKQMIQLLFEAEDWVKRYCNRDFPYRALQTEYYDGTGTDTFCLKRTPVTPASVVISEDWGGNYGQTAGSFAASTALTLGTHYSVPIDSYTNDGLSYSGRVLRIGSVWPYQQVRPPGLLSYVKRRPCPGAIKATYSGGFQLIPHSLKRAVWDRCTLLAQRSTLGRLLQSESGEGYSYSASGPDSAEYPSLESIASALGPFRRIPIG